MLTNPEDYTKARNELARICSAFGVEAPPIGSEGRPLSLIDEGRLVYDDKADKVEYRLASPLDVKAGNSIKSIAFGDPTQKDLEAIHKNIRVVSRSGETEIDLGDMDIMTGRIICQLGGVNSALVDRLKGRDTKSMQEIFTLLGFFG